MPIGVIATQVATLGYSYFEKEDKWGISEIACDYIFIGKNEIDFEIPGTLGVIQNYSMWSVSKKERHYPFISVDGYLEDVELHPKLNFLYVTLSEVTDNLLKKLKDDSRVVLLIDTYNTHGMSEQRCIFIKLLNAGCKTPVVIGRAYGDLSPEKII